MRFYELSLLNVKDVTEGALIGMELQPFYFSSNGQKIIPYKEHLLILTCVSPVLFV